MCEYYWPRAGEAPLLWNNYIYVRKEVMKKRLESATFLSGHSGDPHPGQHN
jgi:hypothetical protein